MKRIMILTLAIILATGLAQARVPQTMNVQGVLMDDVGNVMPDDDYTVFFQIWDAQTAGSDLWGENIVVTQADGFFNVVLGHTEDVTPDLFGQTRWLSMQVAGDSPMEPRIEMTSVASALKAGLVDRGAAVLSLNGLLNNVILQGGTNVTLTQQDSTIVINASTGAGGDDGDWLITGNDVSHALGRVWVGTNPAKAGTEPVLTERGDPNEKLDPVSAKMTVTGLNEGLVSTMSSDNVLTDGRAAIFGRRSRVSANPGTGFGMNETNSAIKGYNVWGDSYTFGVIGHTWHDTPNTGGVMGADYYGNNWAALSFRDSSSVSWGLYTPYDAHIGGLTETGSFRMGNGANNGYILTSDASGNAAWQPPGVAQDDGDWTISGSNMFHSSIGAVAIGTSYPHNWGDSSTATTLQIKALFSPTLALDAQGIFPNNQLHRWTMTGTSSGLKFNKSSNYASTGTTILAIDEGLVEVNRFNGDLGIRLQGEGSLESGSRLEIYSTSANTTLPTAVLDGQASANNFGGVLTLRDGSGQAEVEITANYNGTGIGRVTTPVLEITGGADLSEQFDLGDVSALIKPGMVVSIDPDNPGQLTLSGKAYDRRVAGVISGAGGVNTGMLMGQRGTVADGDLPVALIGRVYVWADASAGPIEPGDLLTSAARPGHAMKVTDHDQATGAILGKAMSGLKEGQGLILTLVTLQ